MRTGRYLHSVVLALSLAAVGLTTPAAAQVQSAQDGIDRNLQQRAAREREFHVGLEDNAPPVPRPFVPGKTGLQISIPTPGSEILRRDKPLPAPSTARVSPGEPVVNGDVLLQDSQNRRQMELQTQLQNRPDPGADAERQQILQIQQLQFNRETSSQDLGSRIMRDSSRALGTPR